MINILILYGTTEGHTARIAEHMAGVARARGHPVETRHAKKLPRDFSWESFGAVIIGASVHYQKHQKYMQHLVKRNLESLQHIPSAFFSVSGAAAQSIKPAEKFVEDFLQETGWQPNKIGIFAGAILYTQYGLFKRLFMKKIMKSKGGPTDTSQDYEYTDWDSVTRFAEEFLISVD